MSNPCAACKFLRRKCTQDCVFAPYFPPENPKKFNNVHKVFGASNVSKLLSELSPDQRADAANSLAYEAGYRLSDPVYGCVGYIAMLQNTLKKVHHDLHNAKKELANYIGPSEMLPNVNHPGSMHQDPNFGVSAYQVMPYNMQPMMGGPAGLPQGALVIRDSQPPPQPPPQQQQILEAQQLAAVAAVREQETFVNYEQQQHQQQNDLERFIKDFDTTGGAVTFTGFNQMIPGSTSAAAHMPPAMDLGSDEGNPYGHHIQQQAVEHSHSHHPQLLDLLPQQQQNATLHHQAQKQQQQDATLHHQAQKQQQQDATLHHQAQQQIFEAQKLAAVAAAREQGMFVNYEQPQHQQQNDLERFISDFDTTGGTVTATGFNQMIPAAAHMPPALHLGSDESIPYGHHIQQQAVEHSHSHHPQLLDLLTPELLLQQQQQQNALLHHLGLEEQQQQQNSTHLEQQQNSTLHHQEQQQQQLDATLHHQAQQQLQQDATLHHQAQQQQRLDATLHHQAQQQLQQDARLHHQAQQQQQQDATLHHQAQQQLQQDATLHHQAQQQQRLDATLHYQAQQQLQQDAILRHQAQQKQQLDATLHHLAQQQLQQDATLHHLAQQLQISQPQRYRSEEGKSTDP